MPIATRADLEAVRGPAYIADLLRSARDSADIPTGDAEELARLNTALQAGDDLIIQFLPESVLSLSPVPSPLLRMAIDESLYYLIRNSQAGASEGDDSAAQMRRLDLAKMRERDQFTGTPDNQRSITVQTVANASGFSYSRLRGLR